MIDELTKKLVEDARDILEGKNPKEEEEERWTKSQVKNFLRSSKTEMTKTLTTMVTPMIVSISTKRRQTIQKKNDTEVINLQVH